MKTMKYLLAGAFLIGMSAQALAQDIKSQIDAISKVIVANKDNPKAAEDQVKEFYKEYKKDPEALAGLGRAYLDIKDTVNATKYAELAIKQGKNNAAGYILFGDIEVAKNDGGAAASWYKQATVLDPKNPQGYIKYANIYRVSSPATAAEMLEKLRVVMPEYPVDAEAAHFFYGARKYDKAVEYYDKVTDRSKLSRDQLREYALAGYFNGNNDKSIEVSSYGNKLYPRDAVLNRMTFYNSLAKKDYATAVKFADALFTASDSAKIISRDYTMCGHAFMGLKDYEKAIDMFKKSLEAEESSDVHKLLSDAYSEAGDVQNAIAEYNAYVSKKENPTASDYMALATIYTNEASKATDVAAKEEAFRKADEVYAQVIEKFPDYKAYGTYMRANINGNLDPDFTKGLSEPYYKELVEIVNARTTKGSNDMGYLKAAYYNLGAISYTRGDKDSGDDYMRKLLEVDPDNATAKQMLGITEETAPAE